MFTVEKYFFQRLLSNVWLYLSEVLIDSNTDWQIKQQLQYI